jgi:hypothetical protein
MIAAVHRIEDKNDCELNVMDGGRGAMKIAIQKQKLHRSDFDLYPPARSLYPIRLLDMAMSTTLLSY